MESVLLEFRNISTDTVVNSLEQLLSARILLETQRLQFMEEALVPAPLTQKQQERLYEVQEKLEILWIQDTIRGWEGHELVVDYFSTSDSSVTTMSPMGTSGTDTTFTLSIHLPPSS